MSALLGVVSLLVALGVWALASPVGATPDEDYHLVSIWCGGGEDDGTCEDGDTAGSREVPRSIREAACFAFKSDVSAQCQVGAFADADPTLVETTRGNFEGDYPPVFYFLMHLFVGTDPSVSVVVMRLVNALLFVALGAATAVLAPAGLRRAVVLAFTVTSVPFGLFLLPSVNPSSWAIMSVPFAFVSLAAFLRAEGRGRTVALGALAGLSVLMGSGARSDAALYLVLAIAAAVLMAGRFRRADLLRLAFAGVLAVGAATSFLTAGQSSAVEGARETPFTWKGFVDLLVSVPSLWQGNFGTWGLGWLDTGMPPMVHVVGWAVFAGALLVALGGRGTRWGLAVGAVAGAVLVVPTYIQYVSDVPVGAGVQPRYILPLLVLLVTAAAARVRGAAVRLSPAQRWSVVLGLGLTNAVALHYNLRRYVTGTDVATLDLDADLEWWWGLPIGPQGTWAVGTVAFVLALGLITADLARPAAAVDVVALRRSARRGPAVTAAEPGHASRTVVVADLESVGDGRAERRPTASSDPRSSGSDLRNP
ncbi:DUF2142 domain-containing protein [Cellulomonas sp. NPDC057328]|uniref:DUF2142 domain-containing protein n=1 Tax=Cellulomonas sp. NPDC057328 TaxID=3346101 RepID=UPI003624D98E